MHRSFLFLMFLVGLTVKGRSQSFGLKGWFDVVAPEQVYEGDHFQLIIRAIPTPDSIWYQHPEEFMLTNNTFKRPEFYAAEEGWWPIIVHATINGRDRSRQVWITVVEP